MSRFYTLFCTYCNYKKITDGSDVNLYEYTTCDIPGGLPKYNPETKKTDAPKSTAQKRKFRCPKCGRAITAKNAPNPQEKVNEANAELERQRMAKVWEEQEVALRIKYEEAKKEEKSE